MANKVQHAELGSMTARLKLKKGRQPHWQELSRNTHLGYQRQKGAAAGRWILRRYLGSGNRYRVTPLDCIADDTADADGLKILSYEQAKAKANAMVGKAGGGKIERLTVRQAMTRYVEWKEGEGETNAVADVTSRGTAHIIPPLGDLVVSELTAETLRRWLSTIAASPAQLRPKGDKLKFAAKAETDEAIRKRRASANRVLTMLKAILNHAFDDEQVSNRDAWGRRLKPFKDVDAARVRYLEIAEAQRLVNGCDADFRPLVRGALETGARYGELTRLEVIDFNVDSGTVHVRKSKSGKERHIILTPQGAAFFKSHCAGRAKTERMFTHADGISPWEKSQQGPRMKEACERATIKPRISIHGLRHTWASHAVMNGVPLMVVAKNLGHASTKMVEKHYGHLAPSFLVDAIHAGAPKYGFGKTDKKVVPLR
jgi:integrase